MTNTTPTYDEYINNEDSEDNDEEWGTLSGIRGPCVILSSRLGRQRHGMHSIQGGSCLTSMNHGWAKGPRGGQKKV
jgi:hypothetical protein